jgi:hypothetical protein
MADFREVALGQHLQINDSMAEYKIVQVDPLPFKNRIIDLWQECLPGTAPERFEWLNAGNPAGKTLWFVAFEEGTNEMAGAVSIMPRMMYRKGAGFRFGILGDFMVSSRCRVFGPTMMLPKTVISKCKELGFDLLYTIPNPDSSKIMERTGLKNKIVLCHLVRPVYMINYLGTYLRKPLDRVAATLANIGVTVASRDTYTIGIGRTREEDKMDSFFDILWERVKAESSFLIGDHSAKYLEWRYFKNPENKFRFITYRKRNSIDLLGYLVFTKGGDKIEIYDMLMKDMSLVYALLRRLVLIAKDEGCKSIYIRIAESNPFLGLLRRSCFLDAQDDGNVMFNSEGIIPGVNWHFLSGDRNT